MILKAAIAVIGLGGLCTPAFATEWVNCAAADGAATFDFLAGSVDFLSIAGLNISAGEDVWASSEAYGPGTPVAVGQAFEDADSIAIDAVDGDMSATIAQLRLFKASEGEDFAYGGTLRIVGHGAWSVSCTGP
jgi:hypothetical protein